MRKRTGPVLLRIRTRMVIRTWKLPLGLYLIVETEVPEEVTVTVAPWLVSLPFTNISDSEQTAQDEDTNTISETWLYDATCYPKDQTGNPTLDKMVRNAYGNILASGGLSSYGTNYVVSAFDDPVGADDAEALVNSRNTEEGRMNTNSAIRRRLLRGTSWTTS